MRTIFNFLGPLTNPAGARRQLIGVSDPAMLDTIAGALARLGVDRALVVAGEDGLDEISISSPTWVVEVNGEELTRRTLSPADVGLEAVDEATELAECGGGTPEHNAEITRAIFAGERGPRRDLAVINAGAAIYAAGVGDSLAEGVALAQARPRRRPRRGHARALRGGHRGACRGGHGRSGAVSAPGPGRGPAARPAPPSVLAEILRTTAEELDRRRATVPLAELEAQPQPRPPGGACATR